nr:thymidylate kinase [Raoultella sp. NCTC 9187]
MSRQLFVALDGPKGAGKTTLLEAITKVLRADNKKVIRLCEKKSDPYRGETMALVNKLARNPALDLEWEVCERFADSRAWISRQVLTKQPADSIILMDRWYPRMPRFVGWCHLPRFYSLIWNETCARRTCMSGWLLRLISHGRGPQADRVG